ncbi:MAG: hypothetical protein KAS32_07365 [Candidatus Peribacteraceae bacterium]|nr:hypothetical protein [Candidatus Peribacteraceae bacterium]
MSGQGIKKMETIDLIYDRIKLVHKDLKDHIEDEKGTITEIKNDIEELNTSNSLMKQRNKYVNAGISTIVASIISGVGLWFSRGGH